MCLRDCLYDEPRAIADFAFDAPTVAVFPDMIQRSIPGYGVLLHLLAVLAAEALPEGGRVYDLGCALGAASLALRNLAPAAEIHALDLSPAMIERLRHILQRENISNIQAETADIGHYDFLPARVFIANFTFQFLEPAARRPLLQKIKEALQPGGLLLLAEKTQAPPQLVHWHEQFKRSQGYSELAIAQKRAALENVMRLDSAAAIEERLAACGFAAMPIFQALSFRAWAAWHA